MFSIIVASDDKRGIALETGDSLVGTLPWAGTVAGVKDTAFFRTTTMYSIVIMGRRTFEAIGQPLKGRMNIVVTSCNREQMLERMPKHATRPKLFEQTGETVWLVAASLGTALEMAFGITSVHSGVFVIGGARLIAEAASDLRLKAIYWSHIPGDYSCNVVLPLEFVRFTDSITPVKCNTDADVDVYLLENIGERKYKNALRRLLAMPVLDNRTGIPAHTGFNMHFEWPLRFAGKASLPLLTLKHTPIRAITHELMWFLSGDQHIDRLAASGVRIWDANTTAEFITARGLDYPPGSVGPAYGAQWRGRTRPLPNMLDSNISRAETTTDNAPEVPRVPLVSDVPDQLAAVIAAIKTDPYSRRHLIVAWNPADIDKMVLPPCHYSIQFHVEPEYGDDGKPTGPKWLSCVVTMRSCDIALGLPFNAASYGILTHMVAYYCGMRAKTIAINATNCHLYSTHDAGAAAMLHRESFVPARFMILPRTEQIRDMNPAEMLDWLADNLSGCFAVNYKSHPKIELPMAV